MRMGFLLLLHSAMHCVQIELGEGLLTNCLAVDYRYGIDIVLAIDWIVLIIHPFGDDKPWICSVLFQSSDRSVS